MKRINGLALATVVIPTAIAVLYYGLIASDLFVSESRFVVRSPQRAGPVPGLGSLLQGAGFARSQDDSYTVHDYIQSRDALRELDQAFAVSRAYSSPKVDLFSRFGALDWDTSFENLHKYYRKRVTVDLDTLSSISTLRTSAFTAVDAHQYNQRLLELAEKLVNQLNERGRTDLVRFAAAEVDAAEKKARAATLAVAAFRGEKSVFDPERQSGLQLQGVSRLQDELIATRTQLAQVRELSASNPQIPALVKRSELLERAIAAETAKVAGGKRSLSATSAEYERLALERALAEKQLAAALASLEQARNEAQRKQLYLERIVQPSKPDVAVEPRRVRIILATFLLGLVAWGILTMLVAGVREHQD